MPNQYKIGEFSKFMGVTPEFLKHYEQYGLIPPSTSEKGYRYYSFEMASEVLECIKLRNWEFSLKEIQKIITELSVEEILEMYAEKITEMKEMIRFYEAVIHDYEQTRKWIESKPDSDDWTIEMLEETVFLTHSNKRDFVHDPGMTRIMEQWVQWMPMVHSCQYISEFRGIENPDFQWGFSVPLHMAQTYGLMIDKPCRIIPAQRCLCIPLTRYTTLNLQGQTSCTEIVEQIVNQYHFEIKGEIYREVFQYSHENGKHTQHCRLIVPLK